MKKGRGRGEGGGWLFLLDFLRTCTQSLFICGWKITRKIALVARSKTFNERRQDFKEQIDMYHIYIFIYVYRGIQIYIQSGLPLNLCNIQAAVAAPAQSSSQSSSRLPSGNAAKC